MARENFPSLPGFRFSPLDSELVGYYLRNKISGSDVGSDLILEHDIYKLEPWHLPDRELAADNFRYFFCPRDKKYTQGGRTNRATERGYWKATGKDRVIYAPKEEIAIGMKKTLVFYQGRAPSGQRTDWVMHEYRLEDDSLRRAHYQDSYVLCKIFNKKGDLNDCSPSVISNVVEETPRLTELPFGNDLYLGEWSGLMEASLANQQGASQEVVTDALMKNFETQHVGASEGQYTLDESFSVDDVPGGKVSFSDTLLSPNPLPPDAPDLTELDSWFCPPAENVQSREKPSTHFLTKAPSQPLLPPRMMRPERPSTSGKIQIRRTEDSSHLPKSNPGRLRMAVKPFLPKQISREALSKLKLTVDQWMALCDMDQEGHLDEAVEEPEIQEITREANERVNRRRSTSRTAGDLTTDAEVEFTPDSLKVDNSYLNRVFFSKNKNGDEEDDELNDQSGSENVNDGEVGVSGNDTENVMKHDFSMSSARTRYVPSLINNSRAKRVPVGLTDEKCRKNKNSFRNLGSTSLSPVLQELAQLLGPPKPAHACEIPEDSSLFLTYSPSSQRRGSFHSASHVREILLERDLVEECSSSGVDTDWPDNGVGLRRRLAYALKAGGGLGEENFQLHESRKRWDSARRVLRNSGQQNVLMNWFLALGAILALCVGVGSFIRLAIMHFGS